MGPVRTSQRSSKEQPSLHAQAGPSKWRPKRIASEGDPTVLPGVQKLKSSIRQTKRLLAKEKLAADVRVTAERKLKSLEEDLAKAETKRKERTLAGRYHKIKFFERQKVVRKIEQTKKKLLDADTSQHKALQKELYEYRVNLNYILHYPKTKKYISLFPPEVRLGSTQSTDAPPADSAKTEAEREEVKKWIREQMSSGEIQQEAELFMNTATKKNSSALPKEWKETRRARKETVDDEAMVDEADDFFESDEDSS